MVSHNLWAGTVEKIENMIGMRPDFMTSLRVLGVSMVTALVSEKVFWKNRKSGQVRG